MDSNKTRKEEMVRIEEDNREGHGIMKQGGTGNEQETWTKEATSRAEVASGRRKWNYIFTGSFKMAIFLPLVILSVEIFVLDYWPDVRNRIPELLYDYLFLFSIIFLIFVCFHLLSWKVRNRLQEP